MLILAGVVAEALVAQPALAVGARQLVRSRGVLLQAEQAERPAPFAGFFQRYDDVPVDQQAVYELQVLLRSDVNIPRLAQALRSRA